MRDVALLHLPSNQLTKIELRGFDENYLYSVSMCHPFTAWRPMPNLSIGANVFTADTASRTHGRYGPVTRMSVGHVVMNGAPLRLNEWYFFRYNTVSLAGFRCATQHGNFVHLCTDYQLSVFWYPTAEYAAADRDIFHQSRDLCFTRGVCLSRFPSIIKLGLPRHKVSRYVYNDQWVSCYLKDASIKVVLFFPPGDNRSAMVQDEHMVDTFYHVPANFDEREIAHV
jgi:hypothetical protein